MRPSLGGRIGRPILERYVNSVHPGVGQRRPRRASRCNTEMNNFIDIPSFVPGQPPRNPSVRRCNFPSVRRAQPVDTDSRLPIPVPHDFTATRARHEAIRPPVLDDRARGGKRRMVFLHLTPPTPSCSFKHAKGPPYSLERNMGLVGRSLGALRRGRA